MTSSTRGLLVVEADDADRGRHRDALALERQAPLADRLEHALGDALRGVAVGVAQQDGELVAAEAGDHVGLADAVVQRAADGADDLVAGLVAARVVDVLEAVEVEQEDRALAAVARGVGDVLGELLVEAAAVEELRQRVVVGQVLQLVLEALALRDVADDAGHDDAVVGVQHREHHVDRELRAVLALAPQLEAHAEGDLRVARGATRAPRRSARRRACGCARRRAPRPGGPGSARGRSRRACRCARWRSRSCRRGRPRRSGPARSRGRP